MTLPSQGPGNSADPPALDLRDLRKEYAGTVAVAGANLALHTGEFVTMLGPSGSGKTTVLNLVAGFVAPTSGTIHLSGTDVSAIPPNKRGLGMVFQNHALFPHMTAAANVGYPLRIRGWNRQRMQAAVEEILDLVDLGALADRKPDQLSGGQQQRVALARALVFEPPLLLMDEPFSSLDRKLRWQLQLELRRLQRRLKTTVLFVTHDQEEALTMSDRVAVMHGGRIEQCSTPELLYEEPETEFIARFVGESNLLRGEVVSRSKDKLDLRHSSGLTFSARAPEQSVAAGTECLVCVRPTRVDVRPGSDAQGWPGKVIERVFLGDKVRFLVESGGETLISTVSNQGVGWVPTVGDEVSASWPSSCASVVEGG